MKFIISDAHFELYQRLLSEQDDIDLERNYDSEDFIEVFYQYFRPWVVTTHGEESGKYPMSYLSRDKKNKIKNAVSEKLKSLGYNMDRVRVLN